MRAVTMSKVLALLCFVLPRNVQGGEELVCRGRQGSLLKHFPVFSAYKVLFSREMGLLIFYKF